MRFKQGALKAAIALALIAASCGGKTLRTDTVIPAIQANKPTAEFNACGKKWIGLGICSVAEGAPLSSLQFSIQGFYEGTIRVVSTTCEVDDSFRYVGSPVVPYELPGLAKKSCLVSISVSPSFPDETKQAVVVHSLRAHLWVAVKKEGETEDLFVTQSPIGVDQKILVPIVGNGGATKVKAFIKGCGAEKQIDLSVIDGHAALLMSEFSSIKEINRCILFGAIEIEGKIRFFTWLAWLHSDKYLHIPTPTYQINDGFITIQTDSNVSIIALDSIYAVDQNVKFPFDKQVPHTIRLLTSGGRLLVGIWNKEGQSFQWNH